MLSWDLHQGSEASKPLISYDLSLSVCFIQPPVLGPFILSLWLWFHHWYLSLLVITQVIGLITSIHHDHRSPKVNLLQATYSRIKSIHFHSIGQFLSFLSLKYPLHTKNATKCHNTLQKLIFGGFGYVSRLMTRSKTFRFEQVNSQVDSILGNLSESTHSLLMSTHSPFFPEPCPFGSEQVDAQVDSILETLDESTHPSFSSTHVLFFFEPFRYGSEQVESTLE